MALLKSTNTLGVDYIEYRDIIYYNKFKYKARIKLEGVNYIHWCDDIDSFKKRLRTYKTRANYDQKKYNRIIKKLHIIDQFLHFKSSIKSDKKNFSIRIENNNAGVFSNDLNKLLELKNLSDKNLGVFVHICEASCSPELGIKYFVRKPKHKFRVYCRSTTITKDNIKILEEKLTNMKSIFMSRSFKMFFETHKKYNWRTGWLSSNYYIDYDSESDLTYLLLMFDNIFGRYYKLEKRSDPE